MEQFTDLFSEVRYYEHVAWKPVAVSLLESEHRSRQYIQTWLIIRRIDKPTEQRRITLNGWKQWPTHLGIN